MKKHYKTVDKKAVQQAISTSSAIEGQSFSRAKKNRSAINLLKQYGRGFSI